MSNAFTTVNIIINHQRPAVSQFRNRIHLLCSEMQTKYKRNNKLCTFSLFTVDFDISAHQIDDVLCNRHTKSCSLYTADGRIFLTFKRLKNMIYKILAHTDARVFNTKHIFRKSVRTVFLRNADTYSAALLRIFHGIADQIQEYLIQSQLITVYLLVHNINRINIEFQLLRTYVSLQNIT